MTDDRVTDDLQAAKDAALEALCQPLHDGDGHPHVTSMLLGGTNDNRADMTELRGMRAAER